MWLVYLVIFIIASYVMIMIHEFTHYILDGGVSVKIGLFPINSFAWVKKPGTPFSNMAPVLINFFTAFLIMDYVNLGVQSVEGIFIVFIGFASFYYLLYYCIIHICIMSINRYTSDLIRSTTYVRTSAILFMIMIYIGLEKYFLLTPQFLRMILPVG